MKSRQRLLFSSFQGGKLQPPVAREKPGGAARFVLPGLLVCVVLAGVSYYLGPESNRPAADAVRLSATESVRQPAAKPEERAATAGPEVFWSVRVLTLGRAAEGADPAPLVKRALKVKGQLEGLGFSPVFALSDVVDGKREYWVSVGRNRNPEDLKELERRLERTALGTDKPFQDAYVCRVAVPPR